ncbi:unnamed protein product [Miscanthus lutarioriparius]|uniref:Major facilitator superfamily (MFS) profile domain-containing protein n=1 Tax=Miscanthus lutarioriparius TaxID=422564 RepID=A0A811R637_9POAL|nr:unnamed protein product [Miscanthus lutarioriparius]
MRDPDAEAASRRRWTLVLVNLASVLEKADEVLLPAVYKEVGAALGASPTALGSLTLCRALVQAACYPLAAYASARHDRARVVAVGAFLWAAATFLVAVSGSFVQVHDLQPGLHPGGSFGVLLAPITFLGVAGWRVAFHAVAVISVALGVLMWLFAADPASPVAKPSKTAASATEEAKELLQHARRVLGVTTFQIIVAQGIAGSIPWSALNFSAMWLELAGFTNWETSVITGLYLFATALGALFGGLIGDPVARRFPNTGRIALAQISSASALPPPPSCCWRCPMTRPPAWRTPPIFAEIVPEKARTTVYALDKCFEAVFASFASPIVGVLAERVFGYKPVSSDTSVDTDRENAAALAKAVYTEIAVPMAICCLTYTFLYCTYPRDRERARKELLMASDDHLGGEASDDNESSVVHTRVDEESSVSSLNQRLIS